MYSVLRTAISDIGTIHETVLDHGRQRSSPVFYGGLHIQAKVAALMVPARYVHASQRKRNILLYTWKISSLAPSIVDVWRLVLSLLTSWLVSLGRHGGWHINRSGHSYATKWQFRRTSLLTITVDGCFNLRISLCIVHEYILVWVCRQDTHLILASARCALVSHCAHFVLGLARCFVTGIFVVDADDESWEGRETGADNANGDFGVTRKEHSVRMFSQRVDWEERTLAYWFS